MHNLESVLENEMHKILLDFEKQTDYPISARRPDLSRPVHKHEQIGLLTSLEKLQPATTG